MTDLETIPAPAGTAEVGNRPSVVVDDVHVTYRIYEDRTPSVRELASRRFRPRAFREVHAVKGVSLVAYPGDAIGVIGRNGSGKSSLMRAVAGLLPTSGGSVHASSVPIMLGVGSVLQIGLSGRRNIYLGGSALGLSRREIDERFDEIVAFSGLRDFIDMPMRAYSSGMRSRLQFAIAVAVTPDILLIDEALSVGDGEFRKKCRERVEELLAGAGTVFIVTHQTPTLRRICNRVIWLDEGAMVMAGDSREVVAAYNEATQVDENE